MWNQSLAMDVLADELVSSLMNGSDNLTAIKMVKKAMPGISDSDAVKICQLVCSLSAHNDDDKVEIVATTPLSFRAKVRKTYPVIQELISGAAQSILLTGYSISGYFEEMLKLINSKSKQGVMVELFVNKYDSVRQVLSDISHINRRFLKVYEYSGKADDKMAALHAKIIIVDSDKMLISSANLSYHGLDSNIEIGSLITSKNKAAQVQEVFSDLKRQKIFSLIQE
jgi:phosphatidylserine/phosphatidylglycerophosphate/cardiolipin synthase-like enzyme